MSVIDLTKANKELTFFFYPGFLNVAGQVLCREFLFYVPYKDADKWDTKKVTVVIPNGNGRPLLRFKILGNEYSDGIDEREYVTAVRFLPANIDRAWPILKPYTTVWDSVNRKFAGKGLEELVAPLPPNTHEVKNQVTHQ